MCGFIITATEFPKDFENGIMKAYFLERFGFEHNSSTRDEFCSEVYKKIFGNGANIDWESIMKVLWSSLVFKSIIVYRFLCVSEIVYSLLSKSDCPLFS